MERTDSLIYSCIAGMIKISLLLFQFYLGSPEQILPGLTQWKVPQHPVHIYGVGNFRALLPPSDQYPLGKPYHIIDAITDETGIHMNRFRPPKPAAKEVLLHTLLTQFHPNAFVHVRFGPRGSIALVRASNEQYLDIVMRWVARQRFVIQLLL